MQCLVRDHHRGELGHGSTLLEWLRIFPAALTERNFLLGLHRSLSDASLSPQSLFINIPMYASIATRACSVTIEDLTACSGAMT